ncbi:hypothetical protein GS597_14380 [Synechococcales cyanobacterium C]|uniref:Uncharacterized protein n=1 Tax=Petrachloros mirabilis ULC683 TaxID=2781853 RepID=A0A8K2A919_9CYAN|nr:hypothetical protein [Petrachloros mirabilis]NCJ07675.1 hypothetical protein [Petrachloros mirabilis ULC683]
MSTVPWSGQTVEAFFSQMTWTRQPLPDLLPLDVAPDLALSQTVEVFFASMGWQGRRLQPQVRQQPLGLADSVQFFFASLPWQGVPQIARPVALKAKPPADASITLENLSDLF